MRVYIVNVKITNPAIKPCRYYETRLKLCPETIYQYRYQFTYHGSTWLDIDELIQAKK